MRARHLVYLAVIAAAAALALGGCTLLGFYSISDRVKAFQDSLNTTDRSTTYENFHPTACSDYDALKNPTFVINTIFPTANISYSLSITDQSNSSAVMVTVTGSGGFAPLYLQLSMQTTGIGDNRIVTLATSSSPSGSFTTQIQ